MRFGMLIALIFSATPALAAGFAADVDVFYFTDSFSTGSGSASTYGRTMWDLAPLIAIDKKAQWMIGWNYDSMSFTDTPSGTTTTLTVTDMGPKIAYYFNKSRSWEIAFTYDLITKGNYASGGTTAELRGTAIKGELGYLPEMWEGIFIGAKLNYYKPSFNEQVVSTTLTKVTDGRTTIYPTFSVTFRWD
jgi:hypothetical protein